MTEPSPTPSRARLLEEQVRARVQRLQQAFLDSTKAGNAEAVATLARLRRCAPDKPGADPTVWQVTLAELPDQLRGRDLPSDAEQAIHAALVLYATHQQSNQYPVHQTGVGLGAAVQRLANARGRDGAPDESCIRRLHQVVLANDHASRLYHLRGLVTMMRAENEPVQLDYARLAVDLWRLLQPRQKNDFVVARWGRDLHNRARTQKTGESE